MTDVTPWRRQKDKEYERTIRAWIGGGVSLRIKNVSDDPYYKLQYLVFEDGEFKEGFGALCDVAGYLVDEYYLAPEGSLWSHPEGGLYAVEEQILGKGAVRTRSYGDDPFDCTSITIESLKSEFTIADWDIDG